MLSLNALILGLAPALSPAGPELESASAQIFAIRVGRAETVSHGTIEHAVVLVENGKIVVVGQDLEIARGIPVIDEPDWVVIPGLVNCMARTGLDSSGGSGLEAHIKASGELYARQDIWRDTLETGVTTLGLYPAGNGIPGQSVAVRPSGDAPDDMVVRDSAYLLVNLSSSASSKKMLRDAFGNVDKYLEKEQKAFEKWEKDVEKAKKKKDDDEKKDEGPGDYAPPEPDAKVVPFMELREGELKALVSIRKSSDYLHLLDAIGEEEFAWDLRVQIRDDCDFHYITDRVGEAGHRVVIDSRVTLVPNTRRQRCLPAEFARAGAKVALLPTSYQVSGHERWLHEVGSLVAHGLDADAALRGMTLEPAAVLRVDDRLGSIEAGKDANLVFLDGDPFEPSTRVQAVMFEGDFVTGPHAAEANQ